MTKNIEVVRNSNNLETRKLQNAGITLIALIITIIILLILAGVAIHFTIGENGILKNAEIAGEETNKQTATEKINLKITNTQMSTYAKEQRMPTLQELANNFCEDNEIEYVTLESKKIANLEKIDVGESTSIFTKLKEYPYEFEINSSLQLASINGIKIAQNNIQEETKGCNPKLLTTITLPSTQANTREVGTYLASSNSYTKTNNDSEFNKYLSYEDEKRLDSIKKWILYDKHLSYGTL